MNMDWTFFNNIIMYVFLGIVSLVILFGFYVVLIDMPGVLKKTSILKKEPYLDDEYNKYYIDLWIHEWGSEYYFEHLKINIYDSNHKRVYYNYDDVSNWKNKYEEFIKYHINNYKNIIEEKFQHNSYIKNLNISDFY